MIEYLLIILCVTIGLILIYYYNKCTMLMRELDSIKSENADINNVIAENTSDSIRVDSLTGLPNRHVFEDRLTQAVNNGSRQKTLFAVMSLCVSNWDDELLAELAARLQMSIRQVDTVSRFADGYFLFLLPHLTRPETAIYVAQRVQDNLLQSFKIENKEVTADFSMGISIYPIDGSSNEALLKNADSAMRQAQHSGKNQYQFYRPELHHLGQRELGVAQLIRGGDSLYEHLQVRYKPFFNSSTNKVVYVQSTPHIHHPKFGMMPYTEFCRIAENSGKMLQINQWLLDTSIQQFNKWRHHGFTPEYLAINSTLKQLENPDFVYKLSDFSKLLQQDAVNLVLEITDDAIPQNPDFIQKLFNTLTADNIKVAVDVVSLAQFATQKINKIPITYLKIDSGIVKKATNHQKKEDILFKIIELATEERIIVLAEGVDNNHQKIRLQSLGCELMEGQLFGYLMPTGSVLELES